MQVRNPIYISLIALCLSACTVGEDYKNPGYDVDTQWDALHDEEMDKSSVTQDDTESKLAGWWAWFSDETLTFLVEEALKNNNDLKIAKARIKEARANERLTNSAFFPQIDAVGTGRRGTLGGFAGDRLDTSKQYGASGSWDIDLFGGNRRRDEAAEYSTQAAEASMEQVRLVLVSDVARNYIRLRGLQKQRALTANNLGIQINAQKAVQARRDEKMVSQLEVERARAQSQGTKARIPQIKREINAAINRLAVLTASKPRLVRELLTEPAPIPTLPASIALKLPINIISSRPDVRIAERQLAEATALTGAAFAEFFPKISLDAFLGKSTSNVYGGLSPWNVTLNGLLPLLNFGRIQAGVDAADARQEQAFYNFRQAVLLAVEDVETSLYAYLSEQERRRYLGEVVAAQGQATIIAREQYSAGIGTQLDLLDAQRNALAAETDMVIAETLVAENLVRLYTALGDGKIPVPEAIEDEMDKQADPAYDAYPSVAPGFSPL